ncbi:ATP-binding response regulator [Pelagicoccus albus]|uniref:histidine kinase n=1 Tax=Pelagicoccus albus TaxID=415222 RepID=A0A7X1E776_9BACT|nr:hybrid sensor histidine kinase/response regulator [Pelagicoccus albus]MBC2605044.1 response regulator [Pelagicoccus albus]
MKVLVVDDSATIRKRIRRELESQHYEVFEASDGASAIAQLDTVRPNIVTLDVDMPGIDGYQTCHQIRTGKGTSLTQVPIIFITANDTVKSRQRGYQAGGNDYVAKPFLPGELSLSIERAMKAQNKLKGRTVLVVEDSSAIRMLIITGLRAIGLRVLGAPDGEKALEVFQENSQSIDLVITDYIMPKLNGDELCRKIRNELGFRELPIIFLSSITEKDIVLKMFRSGASDFITKPFCLDEVQARASVHLESKIQADQLRSNVSEFKEAYSMKEKFLSICSHDLRAPLSGIDGLTQLLLLDETLSEENREYLGLIKSSSDFLFSIIEDLLDLSKIQAESTNLEMAPVNMKRKIDSCVANLIHLASPKNIELVTQINPEDEKDGIILGDKNAVKRIFNNLISNAIKFSHPNDKVTITMTKDTAHRALTVSVTDNGIGIPAEKIPLLFKPGKDTSQLGTSGEQSFGLGMVIVKQLVDQQDGIIKVKSEQNKGTTISVTFPLAAATSTPEPQLQEPAVPSKLAV